MKLRDVRKGVKRLLELFRYVTALVMQSFEINCSCKYNRHSDCKKLTFHSYLLFLKQVNEYNNRRVRDYVLKKWKKLIFMKNLIFLIL